MACASGTDALLMALMADGIGPGDEVITTPYTFFATRRRHRGRGAKPVFVDIDPHTYNIDPLRLEAAITPRTKAIMPVHLFGQCADMAAIMAICDKHKLYGHRRRGPGDRLRVEGQRAGSMADFGCFSFFPSKNLGAAGDGGMMVSHDEESPRTARLLRNHGAKPKYYHSLIGGNFRLDALQAAILRVKLPHLDGWSAKRAKQRRALQPPVRRLQGRPAATTSRARATSTTSTASGWRSATSCAST